MVVKFLKNVLRKKESSKKCLLCECDIPMDMWGISTRVEYDCEVDGKIVREFCLVCETCSVEMDKAAKEDYEYDN